MRIIRLVGAVLLVVGFLLQPRSGPTAVDAQSNDDATAAMEMAYYLSTLESIGDFNTEYDFIHPDARALVPRAAVVGWFLDNYTPRNPQPAVITGVQFVSWTWKVTGVTYPYTAQVSFRQAFNDGVRDDVVRLVQDQNGVWRWFFGRTREFVNEVIRIYVPVPATGGFTGDSLIDTALNDVDAYWRTFFSAETIAYQPPSVIVFDQALFSGCGVIDPLQDGPAYCGADQTIYLNVVVLDDLAARYSPLVVPIIIAHEYGHHVQVEMNIRSASATGIELQADCFAGAWARDYATRYHLSEADLITAMALMIDIGGDPDHGPGTQRSKEFLDGFYDGSQACF